MKSYTVAELNYIKEFHRSPVPELAAALDRTPRAIESQIHLMRKSGKLKPSGRETPRPFTEEEKAYICRFYESDGATDLAAALERNRRVVSALYHRLKRQGKVDHYAAMWDKVGGSQG